MQPYRTVFRLNGWIQWDWIVQSEGVVNNCKYRIIKSVLKILTGGVKYSTYAMQSKLLARHLPFFAPAGTIFLRSETPSASQRPGASEVSLNFSVQMSQNVLCLIWILIFSALFQKGNGGNFPRCFFQYQCQKGLIWMFHDCFGGLVRWGLLTRRLISCTPRGGVVSAQRQVCLPSVCPHSIGT